MSDRTSFYRKHVAMSDESIAAVAPSVFAQAQANGLSERYCFIPTTDVLRIFRDDGWVPVFAAQSKARAPDGKEYAKHVLRFQQPSQQALKVGDSIGEIVVTNSHNGTSSYRLCGGLYRLVCSNGLTVADGLVESVRIRHAGFRGEDVLQAVHTIRERMPAVAHRLEEMRACELDTDARMAFATEARALRWDGTAPVDAEALLEPRRREDIGHDLWTILNVVQENLVQGGVQGRTGGKKPRRMTTREIASVSGNLRLNRDLWTLAERTLLLAA